MNSKVLSQMSSSHQVHLSKTAYCLCITEPLTLVSLLHSVISRNFWKTCDLIKNQFLNMHRLAMTANSPVLKVIRFSNLQWNLNGRKKAHSIQQQFMRMEKSILSTADNLKT